LKNHIILILVFQKLIILKDKSLSTLIFVSTINAPKEKVWDALWKDASYRKWTAVFMDGSYAKSDWAEGS
jgi:hypothetical protein